ncbi:MAG TPA: HD domain-containing phosphohydrolase [Candidatus Polarisedimenticolaceae bacterium]|nr:HD domain-containing phosphohydrolase [Candidatus Polarisedimenticolaceae bacterium]
MTRPAHIVVTDDEPSIRDVLAEGLTSFGYEVRQAGSAGEAFELVRAGGVDLVLSDIDMPGESGLSLLKRIKERDPDVDVVMVTGVVDLDVAIGAIRQGAADYVGKPFNLEEVQIVVERTLEKRRLIKENREYQQTLERKVEERTRELEESYESTLEAMITALDFRDNETMGHSRRVVEYAVIVARTMGVGEPELTWIRRGAILHDVGKIGVSDAILLKPGKLDAAEWEEMKRHPEMGYRMLKHIRFLAPALDIVHCHQERFDGTGYPRSLRGDAIPLGARIFAAVDTFDAMTSDRPYRAALSIQAARDEIRKFSGTQFDPEVASAFLSIDEAVWLEIRNRVHRDAIEEAEAARASHS